MSDLTVITNNQRRPVLYWHDLTAKERKEFDWLDTEAKQDEAEFFRYKGSVYAISEFTSLRVTGTPEFKRWDGYFSDTYFSGILLRYLGSDPDVIVGRFYS